MLERAGLDVQQGKQGVFWLCGRQSRSTPMNRLIDDR